MHGVSTTGDDDAVARFLVGEGNVVFEASPKPDGFGRVGNVGAPQGNEDLLEAVSIFSEIVEVTLGFHLGKDVVRSEDTEEDALFFVEPLGFRVFGKEEGEGARGVP